jgi:hypothetical protein
MEFEEQPKIISCQKCHLQNRFGVLESGEKYYCSTCNRKIWQQPRDNWLELEDFELTKEEKLIHTFLQRNNPKILQWANAKLSHDKWLFGKSSWGRVMSKIRFLVFILPIRAVAEGDSWLQWLLIAIGLFIAFSIIDQIVKRYKVNKLANKIELLEIELGGADHIKNLIELTNHRAWQWNDT